MIIGGGRGKATRMVFAVSLIKGTPCATLLNPHGSPFCDFSVSWVRHLKGYTLHVLYGPPPTHYSHMNNPIDCTNKARKAGPYMLTLRVFVVIFASLRA